MQITIDTKNDKHEIKHLLNMLRAILEENPSSNFSSGNIFDSSSPSLNVYDSASSSNSSSGSGLFNMFDQPSTGSSNAASTTEQKNEKKDFIDQLQLY